MSTTWSTGGRRSTREAGSGRAWHDTKLAQVLYHDWEAQSYDEKWSISFDQRCIDYARDRFAAVAGTDRLALRALARGRLRHRVLPAEPQAGRRPRRVRTSPTSRRAWSRSPSATPKALGFAVEGRAADAESLPYDDDTFDLVVGHAVIHHIPDVELAFSEMLRVLKPGGRCRHLRRADPVRRLRRPAAVPRDLVARPPRSPRCRACGSGWARPREELDESSRAAALEAVVDLHTFDPRQLARDGAAGGVRRCAR